MTFTIKTIGCKVNTYESYKIRDGLMRKGFNFIDIDENEEDSEGFKRLDYFIINTCSVTAMADKKSRQLIRRAKSFNDKIKIVVTGCAANGVSDDKDIIDIIISNENKLRIPEILYEREKKSYDLKINENAVIESPVRSFIKIQDGCDQYCTYCIIPYLRGHIKSRSDDDIINDIKEKLKEGTKEIVLTGIHLSSFGVDRVGANYENEGALDTARNSLVSLMIKIARIEVMDSKIQKVERLRLGSLEPRIINEDFMKALCTFPLDNIFCDSFCLSLQSGSDKILKLMNRHYTTSDYINACDLIKKYMPDAFITTDIIVGFPGETEEDFNETIEFVKEIRFYNPNIFPYSVRKGTKAESFSGQLSNMIKRDRARKLIEICSAITNEIDKEYRKARHDILIENYVYKDGRKYSVGYTKEYVYYKVECS